MKILYAVISCFAICFCSQPVASIDPKADEVLKFWFGTLKGADDYPQDKAKIWFTQDDAIDSEIRKKFEPLVIAASKGQLNRWKKTAKERLALLILLDQFPRNMYRGDARAFSFDRLAQKIALDGVEKKLDLKLLPIERVFFYLPFEHAENLTLQKLSVKKFKEICSAAPHSLKKTYEGYLDYAEQHYQMIKKYGRFPYRNKVLDRKSTPAEKEFLKDPDAGF